jgi:DNA-binding MarR family transcriptional regulator
VSGPVSNRGDEGTGTRTVFGETAVTSPDTELADVVARLRRSMRRAARGADPANPLSVAQLEVLSCLAENPGAQPSQVARALRLAPNSVTTLVNGLATRGLVTRISGENDRRTVRLTLTGSGERAVRDWQATNTAILRTALGDLHPGWQQLLTAALPALRELITAIDQLTDHDRPQ